MRISIYKATILIVVFNLLAVGDSYAQSNNEDSLLSITPPDVYIKAQVVLDKIARIRFIMGKSEPYPVSFEVSDAAPREVYFQAFTLLKKANRLAFEITRSQTPLPEVSTENLQPRHVFQLVLQAIERLQLISAYLGIPPSVEAHPVDPNKTSSDVFNTITIANNELNNLLRYRFAPEDVHQQVTQAISYSAILLSQFPDTQRIPPKPDYIPGKQPRDVFLRLVECFENLRGIAKTSGYEILVLRSDREQNIGQIESSDVYDITSLLISELAFLHQELVHTRSPVQAYYPGPKFPSDVFRRAGILAAQFELLAYKAETNPHWVRANSVSALKIIHNPSP